MAHIMWNNKDCNKQSSGEIKIDAAFRKVKPNSIGIFIWKVENDRIESLPRCQYGTFYDNCTYIIYAAAPKDTFINCETITRESKSNIQLHRFIHFWLGNRTTAEQSASVAYKVIELDNCTGNVATQYREAQGNESNRFFVYFKDGIKILANQEPAQKVHLYEIKGKKTFSCTEKIPIDWSHFNSKHIMILQTEIYIFVWLGRASSYTERKNALKCARQIQTEYQISGMAIVDDGYEQSMLEDRKTEWNCYLNLSQRCVNPIRYDVQRPPTSAIQLKLYKCGFANGKYRIEEIKSNFIQQTDLNDDQVAFIIDGGLHGVWIWLGKHSHRKDKSEAMRNARGFVKKKKYPSSTSVIRIIEQSEPQEFINLFPTWETSETAPTSINGINGNGIKLTNLRNLGKIDAVTLYQRPKYAASIQLIDDGSGEMIIYRISNQTLIEIPKRKNLALFSKDCFLIHYVVMIPENNLMSGQLTTTKHLLYLWSGRECALDTRHCGEKLTNELAKHLGKNVMQIRLHEGQESSHFLQIFNGKLIVFNGHCTDYDANGFCTKYPNSYILKIIGDSTYNSKAIQIGSDSVFTSQDCLVVKTPYDLWVWCGQSSTGDTREIAKSIGSMVGEYILALETMEPEIFWNCLSTNFKNQFRESFVRSMNGLKLKSHQILKDKPSLYICSMEQDQIILDPVLAFSQSDLNPEDIYLMDIGNFLFIWIGSLSLTMDKENCWKIGKYFLSSFQIRRDEHTPMAVIHQGYEPNTFIGFFSEWTANFWINYKTFDMERTCIENTCQSNVPVKKSNKITNNGVDDEFDRYPKYQIDVLRNESSQLPDGIDPKRKEIHLTNDDFVAVFQMHFAEFETLPNWKKQELKKKHKLF